jgi:hypothetical protein
MSRADWQALVEIYRPADKRICNCQDAYSTLHPGGALQYQDGQIKRVDSWQCEHGCSAAQLWARDHVAACVRAAPQEPAE